MVGQNGRLGCERAIFGPSRQEVEERSFSARLEIEELERPLRFKCVIQDF